MYVSRGIYFNLTAPPPLRRAVAVYVIDMWKTGAFRGANLTSLHAFLIRPFTSTRTDIYLYTMCLDN